MNQTVTENHRLRDTIIIGAGLTGLTTAYCLTRKGCDIEVIEQSPAYAARYVPTTKMVLRLKVGPIPV